MDSFVEALICEISQNKDFFKNLGVPLNTIYFGGGTPSLLSPEQLTAIIDALNVNFDISQESLSEFTIEVNPDDVTHDYLSRLREIGVNRLSMGVQSFSDKDLKWMNRRHSASQAVEAFSCARAAGYDNISLDLIFGFELLTLEGWRDNLQKIIGLRPEHISSYQLSIEPKSRLGRLYERGCYNATSQELSEMEYSLLQRMLGEAGYIQYEISNFALPGREAIHNSSYWNMTPYLGLGPAAHSFDGTCRWWNSSNLNNYIIKTSGGKSCSRKERLSERDKFNETVMLSLRRSDGLDLDLLRGRFGESEYNQFYKQLKALPESSVETAGSKIRIPSDKLFLSDGIIRDLFI